MKCLEIRRLFRIVNGGTPTSDENNWGGAIPWATPADLAQFNGVRICSTQRTLTRQGVATGSRTVPPRSLIISTRAPIGYVSESTEHLAFNQGCRGLVPKSDLDIRFFRYQLSAMTKELQALGQGSTFVELSANQLASIRVYAPPLSVQRAIADYLDVETARIDRLIVKNGRMLELMSERLRRFAISLVVGQGNKDTWTPGPYWLGPVPRTWQPYKIAWHKRTASGTTPKSGNSSYYDDVVGTPWVTSSDLRERTICESAQRVTSDAFRDYSTLKMFPTGSVLVAMYGATVGRLGVLGMPAATNQACCAVYGTGPLDQRFLYWWLWANREHLMSMAYGSGQPNISQDLIRGLRVPAPELAEQREIAARIDREELRTERATSTVARLVELLTERRQALIAAVVSGAMPVSGVAA